MANIRIGDINVTPVVSATGVVPFVVADVNAMQLSAAAHYQAFITASIEVLPLSALDGMEVRTKSELQPFQIGKVILDIVVTEEGIESIEVVKVLDDQVDTDSDTALSLSTGKSDAVVTPDQFDRVFGADRPFADSVDYAVVVTRDATKLLEDEAVADSDFRFGLSKTFTDTVVIGSEARLISGVFVNVGRWFDTNTWGSNLWDDNNFWGEDSGDEIHSVIMGSNFGREVVFNREFVEQGVTLDSFNRDVSFSRDLQDTTTTLDNIGSFSIDKLLFDGAFTTDLLLRDADYQRAFLDLVDAGSQTSLRLDKPTTDQVFSVDVSSLDISPVFADTPEVIDAAPILGVSTLTIDVSLVDDIVDLTAQFDRGFTDSSQAVDEMNTTTGKSLSDQTSISELISRDVGRVALDSADLVDQANLSIVVGFTDVASTTDEVDLLYAVGRNAQDTVSSGDEGQFLHTLFWDDNAVWADTGSFYDTVSGNF